MDFLIVKRKLYAYDCLNVRTYIIRGNELKRFPKIC